MLTFLFLCLHAIRILQAWLLGEAMGLNLVATALMLAGWGLPLLPRPAKRMVMLIVAAQFIMLANAFAQGAQLYSQDQLHTLTIYAGVAISLTFMSFFSFCIQVTEHEPFVQD